MLLLFLIAFSVAISEVTVISTFVQAETTVKSEDIGAAITGKEGKVIDATTLAEFDKCRSEIDLKLPVDDVQKAVAKCKKNAEDKSASLASPGFKDVKDRLEKQ